MLRVLIFCFILSSCEYENLELNTNNNISYSKDITPILSHKCSISACHVPGSPTGDFLIYDELKKQIDNKKFQRMVFELKLMPPEMNEQLEQGEIDLLKNWINAGANQD